jgi:hypothetical protein
MMRPEYLSPKKFANADSRSIRFSGATQRNVLSADLSVAYAEKCRYDLSQKAGGGGDTVSQSIKAMLIIMAGVSGFPEFVSVLVKASHKNVKRFRTLPTLYARQCPMVAQPDAGSIPARSTKLLRHTRIAAGRYRRHILLNRSNTAGLNWFRRVSLTLGSSCREWTPRIKCTKPQTPRIFWLRWQAS